MPGLRSLLPDGTRVPLATAVPSALRPGAPMAVPAAAPFRRSGGVLEEPPRLPDAEPSVLRPAPAGVCGGGAAGAVPGPGAARPTGRDPASADTALRCSGGAADGAPGSEPARPPRVGARPAGRLSVGRVRRRGVFLGRPASGEGDTEVLVVGTRGGTAAGERRGVLLMTLCTRAPF
ncbi:hypothetical protein GCM10010478_54800 [Streptomyces erythrogriseus]|uniref:Uncharacterized protein n=2 Tax=Streptomyces griseoincarnatus group TaxID=2867193 RepID=A0ABN3XD09_9ACTN|nr:hypothetical protein GCM10010265_64780 [Streptomyces griseoincarnatus]GGT57094.1 hypothetical protein GCM10010287_34050 [Streptomyces variabilis]